MYYQSIIQAKLQFLTYEKQHLQYKRSTDYTLTIYRVDIMTCK